MTAELIFTLLVTATIALPVTVHFVRARYRHEFIVFDGFAGLLYHEGALKETLAAGRHLRWGKNYRMALVEMRKTLLPVPGQEVLTADHVGVKVSIVLTLQITDAARSALAADSHTQHLYSAAQTAVRTVVAGLTMDVLLGQRVGISGQLRDFIAPSAEAVGVQIHAAEVRDVMLPGELRKAFSEVLKTRQEGQAALERARGESAALRNLANAARLVESQPALVTLRYLQTLEAPNGNRTVVMNDLAALLASHPLRGAKGLGSEEDAT